MDVDQERGFSVSIPNKMSEFTAEWVKHSPVFHYEPPITGRRCVVHFK